MSLTPARKIGFLAVTFLLFVFLVVSLEYCLRWFGYGVEVGLFQRHTIRGANFLRMNHNVKFRYFGSSKFSPSTSPDYFRMPKPEGMYRIFVLGGSTTVGFPYYYNGSFTAYLEQRLKTLFPQKKVEVINLGMTATNSYTARDIGLELEAYQPDLIVDYDGHNEFYGALGVASNQAAGSSRIATLLYLRLIRYRSFQLFRFMVDGVAGLFWGKEEAGVRGTEMEQAAKGHYIPIGSRTYQDAYSMFKDNLHDLSACCRETKTPLILCTQVSDLKDQPPFVSGETKGINQDEKEMLHQELERGKDYQSKSSWDSAEAAFHKAIAADSLYAEAHYLLAQCLEARGRGAEAFLEYRRARDLDELRFRTDSRFNDLIRSMDDGSGCFVSDVERDFERRSTDSLVGHNLITEHLHPNSRGYFLLARTIAQTMREHQLMASAGEWNVADTLNEDRLWNARNVTLLDDRAAARSVEILTSAWPFRGEAVSPPEIPPGDTLGRIAGELATGHIDWNKAHEQAIAFYEHRGDLAGEAAEYEAMISEIPLDLQLYLDLAKVYFRAKRFDALAGTLLRSLDIYPTLQAYRTLGDVFLLQQGDPAGSLKYYERMGDFAQSPQERLQNDFALCYAYAKAGEIAKAKERLQGMLAVHPGFAPAQELLRELNHSGTEKHRPR